MPYRFLKWLCAGSAVLLWLGCSSGSSESSSAGTCSSGSKTVCSCDNGASGTKKCGADGQWAPCQCGNGSDAGADGSAGGHGGSAGHAGAGGSAGAAGSSGSAGAGGGSAGSAGAAGEAGAGGGSSDCGNGHLESGEVCDLTDLGGRTCQTEGFCGGTLGCKVNCQQLDTSACTACCDNNDFCQANGFSSGWHCNGDNRILCSSQGGCNITSDQQSCSGAGCTGGVCNTPCGTTCVGHCGSYNGCSCGGCGAGESCQNNQCVTDCGSVCSGHCGSYNGCSCGGCSGSQSCQNNQCVTNCSSVCSGHCGSYNGCSCGGCSGGDVCNTDYTCAECRNGQTTSESCDPGNYCPMGTQSQTCVNGNWQSGGQCSANPAVDYRYYGDGGTHCGDVVCVRITSSGSDSTLTATVTKANGGPFQYDVGLVLWTPSTMVDLQYGCLSTAGQSSFTVNFHPGDIGLSLGDTIGINAQVASPCYGGQNYVSDDGYVSQCTN